MFCEHQAHAAAGQPGDLPVYKGRVLVTVQHGHAVLIRHPRYPVSEGGPEAWPPMQLDHRYARLIELRGERPGALEAAHHGLDRRSHACRHFDDETFRAPRRQVEHDVHDHGTWIRGHESRPASCVLAGASTGRETG